MEEFQLEAITYTRVRQLRCWGKHWSGNFQDRYAVAVQRRKTVVGHGKISAACSLFLQRAGRICCTVIGVRCFPIHACPLLRRVVILFASRTSILRLRGITFDATLDFSICAFSRPFWVRADDSIARYLLWKCRSILRKVLAYTKPFCLYTFRLHFAFFQRLKMTFNKILADVKFGEN